MAEREGFEPPIPVKVWLISSQLHSTGLCHLSAVRTAAAEPQFTMECMPGTRAQSDAPRHC